MRHYSAERKESVLRRLLPPENKTYSSLSKEEGIPSSTIYTWKKTKERENGMPKNTIKSSNWGVEARFSALVETAKMSELELGEYCRIKGLYPEQLNEWKSEFIAGVSSALPPSRTDRAKEKKDKQRITSLEKELRRKEKALAEAAALLILRKKLEAFYEEGSEDD